MFLNSDDVWFIERDSAVPIYYEPVLLLLDISAFTYSFSNCKPLGVILKLTRLRIINGFIFVSLVFLSLCKIRITIINAINIAYPVLLTLV